MHTDLFTRCFFRIAECRNRNEVPKTKQRTETKDVACSINIIYKRSNQPKISRMYVGIRRMRSNMPHTCMESPRRSLFLSRFGCSTYDRSKMLKTVRNYNSNSGFVNVAIQEQRPGKEYCPTILRSCCTRRFETMIPTMLEPCCNNSKQCRSNVATLFYPENRI